MAMAKKIKVLLAERELTMSDLAKLLNRSNSTLSDKMKRDNFSEKDLIEIGNALNCDYEGFFTMRDTGKKI